MFRVTVLLKHLMSGVKQNSENMSAVRPLGSYVSAECSFSACIDKAIDLTCTHRHSKHRKDNESCMIFDLHIFVIKELNQQILDRQQVSEW